MQPVGIATSEGQDGTEGSCGETELKDCEGQNDPYCLYGETRRKLKAKLKLSWGEYQKEEKGTNDAE